MATAQLAATARAGRGKGSARELRRSGHLPGVIYGHRREPQALAITTRDFERLLEHISAENTVIELTVDGQTSRTLIREIQRHPFRREFLHVDFQELVAGEKVTVRVPIVLVGVAAGVRLEGGVLDQTLRDLEIEVDPAVMPNHIEVDVEELAIGGSIHVRDLKLPPGVEALTDVDAAVCVCAAPRAVVEATPAATPEEGAPGETAEPEVIRKAKTGDEDEETKE
jgi:large subunit ribosomal protein L25